MLLCMLEAVDGGLCLFEVLVVLSALEVLEGDAPCAALHAAS